MTVRRSLATAAASPRPLLLLLLLPILLPIVPNQNSSAQALFLRPPSTLRPYPDLRLPAADRLGVPYEGVAYDAGKAASLPGFALSLDATFGPLDERTFLSLRDAYSGWSETKTRVTWREGRTYALLDFVPPLLQAVSGLHFRSSRTRQRNLPSFLGGPTDRVRKYTEQEVLLTSNCWGFAWEVLFQADNADTSAVTISTADPTSAWGAFTGPGFDLIQSSRTRPGLLTDSALRNARLRGGDVVLVWHQNPSTASGTDLYLDHVATLIDDDVYYEKSGSGDRVPFRINTWDGLTANFPPSVFFWEWRRLVRNNPLSPSVRTDQTRLRPASEVFGVDSQVAAANAANVGGGTLEGDRFAALSELNPTVARRLSLQAETTYAGEGRRGAGGGDVVVEAQTYTGIVVLEDLVFDPETGRASLPPSAFEREWYDMMQMMLPRNPYR